MEKIRVEGAAEGYIEALNRHGVAMCSTHPLQSPSGFAPVKGAIVK